MIWFEYSLSVVGVTLIVSVEWYRLENDVTPILTEDLEFPLIDRAVTPDYVLQAFIQRAREVYRGLQTFIAIQARFGANQNTRTALTL